MYIHTHTIYIHTMPNTCKQPLVSIMVRRAAGIKKPAAALAARSAAKFKGMEPYQDWVKFPGMALW